MKTITVKLQGSRLSVSPDTVNLSRQDPTAEWVKDPTSNPPFNIDFVGFTAGPDGDPNPVAGTGHLMGIPNRRSNGTWEVERHSNPHAHAVTFKYAIFASAVNGHQSFGLDPEIVNDPDTDPPPKG